MLARSASASVRIVSAGSSSANSIRPSVRCTAYAPLLHSAQPSNAASAAMTRRPMG